MELKRGQIGTEYLIIISFVVFAVLTALGVALMYSSSIQDSIRLNQLETGAKKIIFAAENTYYDGEGALSTYEILFPEGIQDFQIRPGEIVFNISTKSGINVIGYGSNVPLTPGSGIISNPVGLRKIQILATSSEAQISLV